jgi:hypothetical protein
VDHHLTPRDVASVVGESAGWDGSHPIAVGGPVNAPNGVVALCRNHHAVLRKSAGRLSVARPESVEEAAQCLWI